MDSSIIPTVIVRIKIPISRSNKNIESSRVRTELVLMWIDVKIGRRLIENKHKLRRTTKSWTRNVARNEIVG